MRAHKTGEIFIASSDSDFYQLLSRNISQIILGGKGTYELLTPQGLVSRLGIPPHRYVYFKSLTGDSADNIKGVPNVGPLRARRIINKELKINLRPHAELLALNKKLIELNCSLNIRRNIDVLAPQPKIMALKNQEIFQGIGF